MSALGQNAKNLALANLVRSDPLSGPQSEVPLLRISGLMRVRSEEWNYTGFSLFVLSGSSLAAISKRGSL